MTLAYSMALGLGAWLVFWIQPLAAKSVLPFLGGSPAVWTTALMFFQAVLLGGYAYAYALARLPSVGRQMAVHGGLMALAALALPPTLDGDWAGSLPDNPIPAVLLVLAGGVGLPLFVLSAGAPLLQHWFSRTGHDRAADPYFLYVASNLGSLGALVAFPFLLEPALSLGEQARAWSWLFGLEGLLLLVCARLAAGRPVPQALPEAGLAAGKRFDWRWIVLAAVPASLLSGVTTVVTTDLGSAPLLWTVPLALYLLTFILAFARRQFLPPRLVLVLFPLALAPVILHQFGIKILGNLGTMAAYFGAFFLAALACHQELAARRPAAERLTAYYLALSAGGLLGGTFNALAAPVLFAGTWEFPLALLAAAALRPTPAGDPAWRRGDGLVPLAILVLVLIPRIAAPWSLRYEAVFLAAAVFAVAAALVAARPLRLAGVLAGAFAVAAAGIPGDTTLFLERNFFGTLKAKVTAEADAVILMHGTTLHGVQLRDPARMLEPQSYYWREGPLGDVFRAFGERHRAGRIGAVGLGGGSVACYARPGESWTFYEIDPAVVRVALDPSLFRFLADCLPGARIVTADARLALARTAETYDLLILDAFSSDAIPLHLLTREAFRTYRDRLAPDGIVALHVTNRYLDLRGLIAAQAEELGLTALYRFGEPPADGPHKDQTAWIALGRAEHLEPLAASGTWKALSAPPGTRLWTDDHADILGPLAARLRGKGLAEP